jgi:molecular chaperone GrpE
MSKRSKTMNDVAEETNVPVRRPGQPSDGENAADTRPDAADTAVAQAAGADRPGVEDRTDEDLQAALRQRDDYYDRLLRKTAEFDNYRKRVERERREQAEYAAGDVLSDLLPLVDDLERALRADADAGTDAYRKGVELIHKQMLDLLRRRGVTSIEAVGHEFDPRLHEAVTHEVAPGHPEGEVIEELRRGYKLRDRLLRPSMVKVAKA